MIDDDEAHAPARRAGDSVLMRDPMQHMNQRGHQENKFRSLYSYQTFKWLILQSQTQQINIEDLQDRLENLEGQLHRIGLKANPTSDHEEITKLKVQVQSIENGVNSVTFQSLERALDVTYSAIRAEISDKISQEGSRHDKELASINNEHKNEIEALLRQMVEIEGRIKEKTDLQEQ